MIKNIIFDLGSVILKGKPISILDDIDIDEDACAELSKRSRGTPRIANRFLKRVRDFAEVSDSNVITLDIAKEALNNLEVDDIGLDYIDRIILNTIIDKFHGGPVGLDTLAAATNEDSNTIEDVYEPYLLQLGFIARTPRGRVALPNAYKHLGKKISTEKQNYLNMYLSEEDNGNN